MVDVGIIGSFSLGGIYTSIAKQRSKRTSSLQVVSKWSKRVKALSEAATSRFWIRALTARGYVQGIKSIAKKKVQAREASKYLFIL